MPLMSYFPSFNYYVATFHTAADDRLSIPTEFPMTQLQMNMVISFLDLFFCITD